MIFEGSRYENASVVPIAGPDGVMRQTIIDAHELPAQAFQFSYYTVKDGDRIDILAQRFLGDAELWWVLADYNPQWLYYDNLPSNTVLRVPSALSV